jgi:hypothetical protein
VNAINSLLGNVGTTVDFSNPLYLRQGSDAEYATLVADMNAGKVGALLIHGVNPSYYRPMLMLKSLIAVWLR